MLQLLRERALRLPDDEALLGELASVKLRESSPGVYRIDHDADKHDDRAVALALAAQRLLERRGSVILSTHSPNRAARRIDGRDPLADRLAELGIPTYDGLRSGL